MYYKIGMIFSTMSVCYEILIIPCLVHGYFMDNFIKILNPFFHINIHMNVLEMIWEKVPHFTNCRILQQGSTMDHIDLEIGLDLGWNLEG